MKKKFISIKDKLKNLSFYRRRPFYIVLTVIFSLILVFDLAVCIFVPAQSAAFGNMQNMRGGMDVPDMEDMSGFDGSDMEIPEDTDDTSVSDDTEDEDVSDETESVEDDTESSDSIDETENVDSKMNFSGDEDESGGRGSISFDFDVSDTDMSDFGDIQQSAGFLQTIKSHWLIIFIIAFILDAGSIFMLVWLSVKKRKAEEEAIMEQAVSDGEVHIIRPKKKKKAPPLLWLIPVAGIVLLVVILNILTSQSTSSASETEASILSGSAELGDISTILPGAGTLTEQTAEEYSLPSEVEILEWYVSNGDAVEAGDKLARVDDVSVMSAIATVQENLTALDEEIAEYEDDEVSDTITAATDGRLKAVYAVSGSSVVDTMYDSGALMLISLDGLMAVSIETDADVSVGDAVVVTLSDGTEVDGSVESVKSGAVVITLTDEGTDYNDSVTVADSDGTDLGSGVLYIHSKLSVTAFTGTISSVSVSVDDEVEAGDTLITLTDTEYTGAFELLVAQRAELEEQMQTLFKLYQEKYIYAETAGVISGLSTSTSSSSDDDTDSASDTEDSSDVSSNADLYGENEIICSISAVDISYNTATASESSTSSESAFVNYIGTVSSIDDDGNATLALLPDTYTIEDYSDLSGIDLSEGNMTAEGSITLSSSIIIFTYENGSWKSGTADSIEEGDIVILMCSSDADIDNLSPICIIRVTETTDETGSSSGSGTSENNTGSGTSDNSSSNGSSQFENSDNSGSGNDSGSQEMSGMSSDSEMSANGGQSGDVSGSSSDMSGDISVSSDAVSADSTGGDGTAELEEEISQTYGVTETTLFSITPQETMSITITIDELDILSLSVGLEAVVTLDAFPGQSFEGVVESIDLSGTNSGGNSKFTAVVTIAREENMLAGMNASVKITLDTEENVLCIPEAALVEAETGVYVYTSYDEKSDTLGDLVEVTTGLSDGENVQILSGLDEGSEYWYSSLDTVNYSSAFASGSAGGFSFNFFGGGR